MLLSSRFITAQWVQTNGPYDIPVTCLAVSGTNLFAGTSPSGVFGSGVFLSTNNGTNWTGVNNGITGNGLKVGALAVSGTNLFAGTGGGVYLSTNNGTSWNAVNNGIPDGWAVNSLAVSGTNLFAGISVLGVYLSTNNGTSWTPVNNGLPNGLLVNVFAVSGTNLFAGTYGGGVYLSTNNGTSWNAVNNGLTGSGLYVDAFAVSGTNLYAGTYGGGVYLSSNNGISWTAVNNGLTGSGLEINDFAVLGTNLFAGTWGGVYLSTNNGTSWTAVNNGLTGSGLNVYALAVLGTNLFAGTYFNAVWRRPLSEMIAITTFPYIQISSSTIIQSGVLGITGNQFTPGGQVSLGFTSSSGVNIPEVIMNANSNGEISYNFNASTYPPGNYNVVGYDITTNKYTINKSFEIISSAPVIYSIKVTAPSSGYMAYPGQEFRVSWTDKMSLSSNYPMVGAWRKYKYFIDLSSDGGSTWNRKDSLYGLGPIDEFVNLNKGISLDQPGQNYRIKIIDFYNTSRNEVSAVFTVSNQALTNLKADFMWDYSYNNRLGKPIGCVADGISRIYIRLYKINPSTGKDISKVEFSLNDGTSDLRTNGKLKVASVIDQWSDEANGANLLSASVNSAINDTFWVWYVAPDDFVRTGYGDEFDGSREVQLTINATYTDNTFEIVPVNPIKIYRPPLMLVHGLGDYPVLWDHYPLKIEYSYLFPIISTPPIGNRDHYEYNAKGLLKLNNSLDGDSFEDVIESTRVDKRVACNQLYYVGHSMGGILPRYCETYLNSSFKTPRNYNSGFINKLITIDTPHRGSPWADYLYSLNTSGAYIAKIFSLCPGFFLNAFFDFNYRVSPAVNDLRINGGVKFNTSAIKANAIVGDMIDGNEPDINNITNSIIDQLNYNKFFPIGLSFLDLFHNKPFYFSKRNFLKKINENLYSFNNQNDFIANSDFIVSTNSQGSDPDITASNISYISGYFHSQSTGSPGIVNATYNKVIEILNSSIDSPLLGYFSQTYSTSTKLADKINTAVISKLDTTFITPFEPIPFSSFNVNSNKNISFYISDTTGLSNVGIIFQTNSFQTSEKNFSYNFSVQTDGNYLDTQKVLIYAFYQRGDSVILSTKEIPVIVSTDESLISFNVTQKVFKMRKGDRQTPNFKGVFDTFLSEIGTQGTSISTVVENENIVRFNDSEKTFEAVGNGETSAIVSYKGKSDTVYFKINGEGFVPVELTSFTGVQSGNKISLKWETQTETNNRGFEIERKNLNEKDFTRIGFIDGNGTTTKPRGYSFIDSPIEEDLYFYRVKQIDYDGSFTYTPTIQVDFHGVPVNFALFQNFPNPFNPVTKIRYSIPNTSTVKIRIYNSLGEMVKQIVNEIQGANNYEIEFDGSGFASGVYFYSLEAYALEGGLRFQNTKKMIVLK